MNEVLLLKRTESSPDDGMFTCYTGVMNCSDFKEYKATFSEQRRADWFIKSFLRDRNKSIEDYSSTEEVLVDFLNYCTYVTVEGEEYDFIESLEKFNRR